MRPSFLVLLLFGGACAWVQTVWKHSDVLGHALGEADAASRQSGWMLRIEPRKDGETRTLFHDGREDSVRLIEFDGNGHAVKVTEQRGGQSIWEVTYDGRSGLPVTETTFQDSQPSEISHLEYSQRILVGRRVENASGQPLYTDTLEHWPDGTLRRLERDDKNGPQADAAWSYDAPRHLSGAWAIDSDGRSRGEHREWTYGPGKTEETFFDGADVVSTRLVEALEDGKSKETLTDRASSRVEKKLIDAQGRTVEAIVSVKGEVQQLLRWTYDLKGRITEATVDSTVSRDVSSYIYRDDGTALARFTRDGVVVREETQKNGEKTSVSLFDRGNLFLVETWAGGKKIKETYYRKGAVVRERTP